jgi:hypothetical protein
MERLAEKRRKDLLDCLAKKEKLSEDDETWLDTKQVSFLTLPFQPTPFLHASRSPLCFAPMTLYSQQKEMLKAPSTNLNKPVCFSM